MAQIFNKGDIVEYTLKDNLYINLIRGKYIGIINEYDENKNEYTIQHLNGVININSKLVKLIHSDLISNPPDDELKKLIPKSIIDNTVFIDLGSVITYTIFRYTFIGIIVENIFNKYRIFHLVRPEIATDPKIITIDDIPKNIINVIGIPKITNIPEKITEHKDSKFKYGDLVEYQINNSTIFKNGQYVGKYIKEIEIDTYYEELRKNIKILKYYILHLDSIHVVKQDLIEDDSGILVNVNSEKRYSLQESIKKTSLSITKSPELLKPSIAPKLSKKLPPKKDISLEDIILKNQSFRYIEDIKQKFIINEFSKFEGVQARRCKNENKFLEIIKNRIETNSNINSTNKLFST
jgi:hypothetical protein